MNRPSDRGTGGPPLGEFELIDRFFARTSAGAPARPDVVLGIGDDAAVLCPAPGLCLAAAVDTLVAGRHFPADATPHSVGYRSLAVNLSDLAAMGARPRWVTLALTLPRADADWLEAFASGFAELAAAHEVVLVGGDTTAGSLTISVQILGEVGAEEALRRGGGGEGDWLVVTGTLGDAAAGLALHLGELECIEHAAHREWLMRRFDYPTPRVAFGLAARGLASAAMDLSDGLAGDLPKLAAASGLAAHVDVDRLPRSAALAALASAPRALEWALSGGDDYELLLAVPPSRLDALVAAARRLDLDLTVIGDLRRGNGVHWSASGREFPTPVAGFDHFR